MLLGCHTSQLALLKFLSSEMGGGAAASYIALVVVMNSIANQ